MYFNHIIEKLTVLRSSLLRNKLFITGSKFSISSTMVSLATMINGLVMIRWLEPSEIGMWQAVSIIQAYLPFLQLGVQSSLNRELPVLLGKNERIRSYELISTAKSYALILSGFFLISTIIATWIFYELGKEIEFIAGIGTIGLIAACFSYHNHLIVTYRSTKSFDRLTKVYFIHSFLLFALLPFIYLLKYYGILLYFSISNISLLILTHFSRPFKEIKPKFNRLNFIQLVKTGLLLMSYIQIRSAANSIPRILILKFGGTTMLGLFSPAMAIGNLIMLLPKSIAQFFYLQMGYKHGQTGNARDLWKPVKKVFWLFTLLCIPLSVVIWFAAPYLLEFLFPKYMESLWPMRIMALAFVFSGSFTTHGVLLSIKAYKIAYIYSIVELFGLLGFTLLFILIGKNILIDATLGILVVKIILMVLNYALLRYALHLPAFNQN